MLIRLLLGIIAMFFTVVFVHELGHYLFAKSFGCKLVQLTLGPFKIVRDNNGFHIKVTEHIRDFGGTVHIQPINLESVTKNKLALYFIGGPVISIVVSIVLIVAGVLCHSIELLLAGGMSFGVGFMNLIPIKNRVGLYLNDGVRALEVYRDSSIGKCEYDLWYLGAVINTYNHIPVNDKDKLNRLVVAEDIVYKVTASFMALYSEGITKKEQEEIYENTKNLKSNNTVIQNYISQTIIQMKGVIYDTNL